MINYLKAQIDEIQKDQNLRFYGLALALTHLWSFFYWNRNNFFVNAQSAINSEVICFPFFPTCHSFLASITPDNWQRVLYAYLGVGLLTCALFLKRSLVPAGLLAFAFVTLFKLALHLSNYNFMGNYHYMVHWVSLVFLFVPNKKRTIQWLIIGFYFFAGLLKLNIDWLSGAAMIQTPLITGNLLRASLVYVLFLELIFVFGLIHHNRWVRWLVLAQFLGFHIFSWHIVGFYYPMMMFSLLAVFFLEEYRLRKTGSNQPDSQLSLSRLGLAALALFVFMQMIPYLLKKDPSVSGLARLSSLNMFDSKTDCHGLLVGSTTQGQVHLAPPLKNMGVRLKCDPIVFLNQANQLCEKNRASKELNKLSLYLFSRRTTSHQYKKVLGIKEVCQLSNPLLGELEAIQ